MTSRLEDIKIIRKETKRKINVFIFMTLEVNTDSKLHKQGMKIFLRK